MGRMMRIAEKKNIKKGKCKWNKRRKFVKEKKYENDA